MPESERGTKGLERMRGYNGIEAILSMSEIEVCGIGFYWSLLTCWR